MCIRDRPDAHAAHRVSFRPCARSTNLCRVEHARGRADDRQAKLKSTHQAASSCCKRLQLLLHIGRSKLISGRR
eukprot:4802129-Alexandrium_andersonii.AAC.1